MSVLPIIHLSVLCLAGDEQAWDEWSAARVSAGVRELRIDLQKRVNLGIQWAGETRDTRIKKMDKRLQTEEVELVSMYQAMKKEFVDEGAARLTTAQAAEVALILDQR